MELTTTLNAIRKHGPCVEGWEKLLRHLGKTGPDDELLPFAVILQSNGLDDALWCCRTAPQYDREWRLFAVWCARQVVHLMPDPACVAAFEAELSAAGNAAGSVAWAAERAAERAAGSAAWAARRAAERAAESAAWAAGSAAWAARRAARSTQATAFRHLITTGSLEGFQ